MPRFWPSTVLALGTVIVTACGPSADVVVEPLPDELPPISDTAEVNVVDHRFEPAAITVTAGTQVTWQWQGRAAHDVVGPDFDSGVLITGEFAHGFSAPGAYRYVCTLHPGMAATVFVVDDTMR